MAAERSRMGDAELAHTIGVNKATVYNTRNRYLRLGVQETVNRRARKDKGIAEKLDDRGAYHCPGLLSYTQRRTRLDPKDVGRQAGQARVGRVNIA